MIFVCNSDGTIWGIRQAEPGGDVWFFELVQYAAVTGKSLFPLDDGYH
jgi:hypothetical protein